ncbi:MAG: hypothetical protein RLZ12_106 [Bacillota bacterium]|jgi:asparaginyl-tRNA synthetase
MLTNIVDLPKYTKEEEVSFGGWISKKRSSGKIIFLEVRDGTGNIQAVVCQQNVSAEVWQLVQGLTQESSCYIYGKVNPDARAQSGYELTVSNVKLLSLAHEYPIANKEHGIEFLLDHRHLWLRSARQRAILKVRAATIKYIKRYLDDNNFIQVDAPILTPASCEGTTELFHTSYFDDEAFLSQSGQLYMEAAAMALSRVYCFGPTFRHERSKTKRHLIEFWMIEPEMAFVEHAQNLEIQESMLEFVIKEVLAECTAELKLLDRDLTKLNSIKKPFPRITYDEAITILHKKGFTDFTWGEDLGAKEERELAASFTKPLFVTHYPAKIKSFYMQPVKNRPEVVLCADLLAPEGYGEIIGGSERIHDLELLKQRFEEHNLPKETYKWYLELRAYGSVPHSGFGLGLERLVAWICGLSHVREAIPFPRMLNRFYP